MAMAMADDRVHPQDEQLSTPQNPIPPATYVIQIPKDQIYRVPPPENADRFKRLSRRQPSRSCCCCCRFFCFTLLTLILLLAIASAIFYLVFRPQAPHYSINSISIKPFNLSSSSSISPQFNISVTADNPNNHIGIYYEKDSSVEGYYQDVLLCEGVLPRFYQPKNNVTVLNVELKGSGIQLTSSVEKQLVSGEESGKVALKVKLRAPVKIKVGSVNTWRMKVKVNCDVTVDKLTSESKIVSKDCDYGVELW